MQVEVYRNLHRKVWSVRKAHGKVLRWAGSVFISDATLVVRQAGRAKVLATGRKNAHAFVRGHDHFAPTVSEAKLEERMAYGDVIVELTYNPRKYSTFVIKATGVNVSKADGVWLCASGRVFATGVR